MHRGGEIGEVTTPLHHNSENPSHKNLTPPAPLSKKVVDPQDLEYILERTHSPYVVIHEVPKGASSSQVEGRLRYVL